MTFDNIENIVSLVCTIVGLLYCVFKYAETPVRGYRYVIAFFLANFLSEYYWTTYELVMGDYPNVSEFAAYLGWNVGFFCLLLATFYLRPEGAKRYFHPVILLPVLLNIPQFLLYISYGGILNNIWMVGTTTLTAVFSLQNLAFYLKSNRKREAPPLFSMLVLVFIIAKYSMWTSSCFSWSSHLLNPYLYCTIIASLVSVFFAYGVRHYYETRGIEVKPVNASDMRFHVLIQTVITLVIIGICAGGFFTAFRISRSLADESGIIQNEGQLVIYLFAISAILILFVLAMLYFLTSRYRHAIDVDRKVSEGNRNRFNFIITIIITFSLMAFAVAYNNITLYHASVTSVNEDGNEAIKSIATELENYLTVAATTLRVAADTVDLMEKNGSSVDEIKNYIVAETTKQAEQFDENFTGIYAYIDGHYLDGLNWVPPKGYDPTSRDWYKAAVEAKGETVIVSPYVDAQTGSVVITIAQCISDPAKGKDNKSQNVVCLDVIVNYIQEVTQEVEIAGKGYGMVVNTDGFIIAHRDSDLNGQNITDIYGDDLVKRIQRVRNGRFTAKAEGEEYTIFVSPVMDQWYSMIVINNAELYEETQSQLVVNIMVSFLIFCLISFFYYIGYKTEQIYRRKVEEMDLQVVTALATAIDAKDRYTNGHSSRVAEYARMIAARAGCSMQEQDEIYMMGLLHDVGKIGVPDSVINKPSRLTDEEYELIKKHPVIGNDILESIKERPSLAIGARWHHERYDGGGYPDGIAGTEIPEEARIIAIADAYDAMTSRRSYRDIMPQAKVRSEIERGMGTQFDPQFAELMLAMIDEDKEYTMREK